MVVVQGFRAFEACLVPFMAPAWEPYRFFYVGGFVGFLFWEGLPCYPTFHHDSSLMITFFCRFVGGFRAASSPLPTTMLQYRMVCLRQQNPPTKLFTRKSPLCVPKWIVYSHCRILGEDICVCQDGRRTKRVVLPSKHQLEAWQMISNEFIRQQAPHK